MRACSLERADSELLEIAGGEWTMCSMRYMSFYKQIFENTDFSESDMTGTIFKKCTVKNCVFNEIVSDNMAFLDCDIRSSDINGADLTVMSFEGSKIDLQQCVLIAEQLSKASFEPSE